MNKFLKKSLSIALAVAMLMTVCAVSFGASAAVGSSVNWDFTDDTVNAANLAELKDNATFFGSVDGGYPDNYTIATPTDDRLLNPTSVLNIAAAGEQKVNGFVLKDAVPTYLHAVVGEKRTYTNTISWQRGTDGLIFAKDNLGGYLQLMPYMPGSTGTVRVAVRYIKRNADLTTYAATVAQNHLADINTTNITKVVYDNGTEETPDNLTTTDLACTKKDDANNRVKYDIKASFDGKKVTFSVTVINAAGNTTNKWRDSFQRNGNTIASYTLADIVLDLESPDVYSNASDNGKPFSKQYKVMNPGVDYDAANIDFAAGIVIAPQTGSCAGYVYSFEGNFEAGCTHANKYEVVDKAATCMVAGAGHWYCPDCKKVLESYSIEKKTHDNNCSCIKLYSQVVITDGVIGVALTAGMAEIEGQTDNRWQMDMKIGDGEWERAGDTSEAETYETGYYIKKYAGTTVDPVTGKETTEKATPNAVRLTDISKYYDQMTQEITVSVRYAPAYLVAENGKAVDDYMIGEGSVTRKEDGKVDTTVQLDDSNCLAKTFKFTIADCLEGIYNTVGVDENLKELALKTANYGAAAQDYFQYEEDYSGNRANDWVTDESLKTVDDNAYAGVVDVAKVENKKEGVKVAATVQLKNKLGIAVSINQNDAKAYLVDGDKETELTTEAAKQGDEIVGTKAAYFGITATQMANGYTIRFKDSDGNTLADVTYSVNSYIARQGKKETTSAALKTLVNAMAEFYTAAVKVVEA